MSKESTLERVALDIQRGDLGKARQRLHGLIATYPCDLGLRARLAEVYWKLQYPSMAGRYWYLEKERTDEMQAAATAFEKECGGDSWLILKGLKLRMNFQAIEEPFARATIDGLVKACKWGHWHELPDLQKPRRGRRSKREEVLDAARCCGCALAVLTAAFLFFGGIIAFTEWFGSF